MGYQTDFEGYFTIGLKQNLIENQEEMKKPLSLKEIVTQGKTILDDLSQIQTLKFINLLANSRRMKRDTNVLSEMYNVSPDYFGVDGEFFVNPHDFNSYGQSNDKSVIEYNKPASTQPSLWLQWNVVAKNDGFVLQWDENEKFYCHEEWLRYLINNFFIPKNMVLNGKVSWYGEDEEDFGDYIIVDNVLTVVIGQNLIENK